MKILVTGGAGYIGSHTCVELLNEDYDVVVLDNLSNSSEESLTRIKSITGKSLEFYKADLLNKKQIVSVFSDHKYRCGHSFRRVKDRGGVCDDPVKILS